MEFYKQSLQEIAQEDIENEFKYIDELKEYLFEFLKNNGLKVAEEMKRLDEEVENNFYKNTFIKK